MSNFLMQSGDTAENLNLRLPPECGLEALGSAFALRENDHESDRLTFYDTWELSLWFQRLFLFTKRDKIHLAERENDWPDNVLSIADTQRPFPRFSKEFADPQLRERLSEIAGLRALGVVARLRTIRKNADLLNKNRKVVCRLELTEISTNEGELFYRLITLRPLRGYETEARKARDLLKSSGATPVVAGPLATLFEREGRPPRPYTLKPVFNIRPETPAREAIRKIVHRMLEIGLSNEYGIVKDIDTEFLHDYRICIRKIRSVLSLVKGVFPGEQTDSLKRTLAALGSATNRLRDLDVYLLARDDYTHLLPEVLRPGLETMFHDFAQQRKLALRKVRVHLTSSEYRSQMADLDRFFTAPDRLPESPSSGHPIGLLVARRIRKRYRKIHQLRRTLTPETPDKMVHELRIDCKKLRYLLEFFNELFAAEESARIQKQLRRLQNRLGNFNDYAVQQNSLMDYWTRKRRACGSGEASDALSLSIGGLIAVLYKQQQFERERIHGALDVFCGKKVRELFKRVFEVDPIDQPEALVLC